MIWQRDLEHAGQSQRVVLKQCAEDRFEIQIGDETHTIEVTRRASGMVAFVWEGRRYSARGGMAGDRLQVRMNGETWTLGAQEQRRCAIQAESSGEVQAPMTGTVLQVLVEAGHEVEVGQPLVLLSAMKMEHRLEAKISGVVTELHAEEGATVEQGDLLVLIK